MIPFSFRVILILGDFNDRCVFWDDKHPTSELGTRLLDCTNSLNMFQLVSQPTRYTKDHAHILDLIFTDSPGVVGSVEVLPPIESLDHCIISCKLQFSCHSSHVFSRKLWDYKNANFDDLNRTLMGSVDIEMADDIDDCLRSFYHCMDTAMERHIPP